MFFSNLLKKKMTLKFSKQTFALQNVPDLLLNVFDYFTGPLNATKNRIYAYIRK